MLATNKIRKLRFDPSEVDRSVAARFEKVAHDLPEKLAYVGNDIVLTYDQLNCHANRIARLLIEETGRHPCRIGILLDQSGLNFVSILGVLKAGKCFVPLDPHVPTERLLTYIDKAQIKCILTISDNQELSDTLVSACALRVNVNAVPDELSDENLNLQVSPDAEGFIIFTSGSTGVPKGVVQPHRSIMHSTWSFTREFNVTSDDRQLMLYTPGVFGAQREMFLGLLNGTTTYHYPAREKGVMELAQCIEKNRITIYGSVATVFRRLLGQLGKDQRFDSVRIVKVGGEATYWADVDLFEKHFSKECKLFCGFSMTEANLMTSMFVERNQPRKGDRVPLGRPIAGKKIFVVRPDGNPCSEEEVGEICVQSRFIATGYAGDAALTGARFQTDNLDPTLVTYKTGDRGYFGADGVLYFEGRTDHQTKIRGFRVDLTEVESTLIGLEDIQECAVKTHEYPDRDVRIVAYVVFKPESTHSIAQLRMSLSEKLTSYMIPSQFVILDEIPQTSSGKVDRVALRKPETVSRDDTQEYVEPRNKTEAFLKSCWESWLEIAGVGTEDDFFDVGGDSLSATQLLLDVNEAFGVNLGPEEIFNDCRTIRGMSEKLQKECKEFAQSDLPSLGVSDCLPFDIDFIDGAADVNRTNRPALYLIDSKTGLRIGKPGSSDGVIRLNNKGFRSPDIETEKPDDVIRVAFLGSSSMFDPFASSNERTWPHLTVELLKAEFPEQKIDFINAALPGSSTARIEKLYENFVTEFKPDLIILRTNDLNHDTAYLARNQGIYDGVPFRISAVGNRFQTWKRVEKNLIVLGRTLASLSDRNKLNVESVPVANVYRDRVVHLIEACKERGSTVVLTECNRLNKDRSLFQNLRAMSTRCLYMPYLSLRGLIKLEEAYHAARVAAARQTGITHIDTSKSIPSDRKHYADATHFRDAGSARLAQVLAGELAKPGEISELFSRGTK